MIHPRFYLKVHQIEIKGWVKYSSAPGTQGPRNEFRIAALLNAG